jgi:carbamoyltransferase
MDDAGTRNLCLAGGVALNCVANGEIIRNTNVEGFFVQPAAGDAGGALGVALWAWHQLLDKPRGWSQESPYMGPAYTEAELTAALNRYGAVYRRLERAELLENTAELIDRSMVVGWYQGSLEWGPRALGHRSILGDPRRPEMQSRMNLKIKHRESFRPFAPVVLAERAHEFFDLGAPSPYMLLVAQVAESQRLPVDPTATGLARLKQLRSTLPAVTHVDGSARVQTVTAEANPRLHALLRAFESRTGCPVLINTSFNVRGEPVVASPDDAYRCFINSGIDILVVGNLWLERSEQPHASLP